MNPFEFVKSINANKSIMVDEETEAAYNAYMVNHSFSYFPETVLFANEMNIRHQIPSKLKYDFLLNTIRKNPRRFSKWNKVKHDDDFLAVKEYYGYNNEKTRYALSLLSKEQIEEIKRKVDKGGTQSKRKAV